MRARAPAMSSGASGAEGLADEEHVAARSERGDGGAAGRAAPRHGVHLEVVAEEDTPKAETAAEEVRADGA